MQKTASLFKRDYEGTRQVYDEVVEGSEWVVNGEGVATRKYDGTCCMVENGTLYKRYEVKKGKKAPIDFVPANDLDPNTGKQHGWRPATDGPDDKYHMQAFSGDEPDGTFELVGPKIQGNHEGYGQHELVKHSEAEKLIDCPRDFEGIKAYLADKNIEGIVWHHPDGRMVKIKKRDFGLKRTVQ